MVKSMVKKNPIIYKKAPSLATQEIEQFIY
nr:MAG TPA: hypothetical protein [Caudoviricetes sp.]